MNVRNAESFGYVIGQNREIFEMESDAPLRVVIIAQFRARQTDSVFEEIRTFCLFIVTLYFAHIFEFLLVRSHVRDRAIPQKLSPIAVLLLK